MLERLRNFEVILFDDKLLLFNASQWHLSPLRHVPSDLSFCRLFSTLFPLYWEFSHETLDRSFFFTYFVFRIRRFLLTAPWTQCSCWEQGIHEVECHLYAFLIRTRCFWAFLQSSFSRNSFSKSCNARLTTFDGSRAPHRRWCWRKIDQLN